MNRSYERMNRAPGLSISPPGESNVGKLVNATSATNSTVRELRNSGKNTAGRKVRVARPKMGIDITWVTERIGVGGGIWTVENMAAVARAGVTHIIDMQIEFDDTPLADRHEIAVCWNPVDDDFEPKPAAIFARGVDFALAALEEDGTKLLVHCAAGVHRAPMMTLALLGVMGWSVEDAMRLVEARRPVADFAEVYVRSVEDFLQGRS
ncbi:MAG TPA: dual specificity protein phosphatase [Candidatus Deferrimicrobiaceae bacterium]|jgi:protein-tyrosine phosphatase|nr:dual specificity protein phosphatase [Candidatus Deferrimicrobiaceae bacterium]